MKLRVYADPGHAWAFVPFDQITDSTKLLNVSRFSYWDRCGIYLEEDSDIRLAADLLGVPVSSLEWSESEVSDTAIRSKRSWNSDGYNHYRQNFGQYTRPATYSPLENNL